MYVERRPWSNEASEVTLVAALRARARLPKQPSHKGNKVETQFPDCSAHGCND